MEGINKRYPILLEALTPVSIGGGAENNLSAGIDYVVRDKVAYGLNFKKIIAYDIIDVDSLNRYLSTQDNGELLRRIGNKLESVSDFKKRLPASTNGSIKSQVKNSLSGKPIVPGSSIKGALRSILYERLLAGGQLDESKVFGSAKDGTEFMRFIKFSDAEFDGVELINTKVYNLQQHGGSFLGGWKHAKTQTDDKYRPVGFNTIYEAIMPHSQAAAELMMSPLCLNALNRIDNNRSGATPEKSALVSDIKCLFRAVNAHTRQYLSKEIEFFSKYSAERSEEIVDSLEAIRNLIPADDSYCILKMAAGSGFHSITGDWQFDDYSINSIRQIHGINRGMLGGKPSSKSRKIAIVDNRLSLMGFIKISEMTDAQVVEAEKKRQQRKTELMENHKKRLETDKALKDILDPKIEAEYESCISQLDSLDDKRHEVERKTAGVIFTALSSGCPKEICDVAGKHIDEILSILGNAATILQDALDRFPKHKSDLNNRNSENEQCIKSRKNQKTIIENNRQATQKADMGLIFLEEKYDDGPKKGCYKVTDFKGASSRIKQWLKKNHGPTIDDSGLDVFQTSMKRLFETADKKEKGMWLDYQSSIWKDIRQWCGEQLSSEMFKKLK